MESPPDANGRADKNGHLASAARHKWTHAYNKMRRAAGDALRSSMGMAWGLDLCSRLLLVAASRKPFLLGVLVDLLVATMDDTVENLNGITLEQFPRSVQKSRSWKLLIKFS
jgi:hypothetical protein